MLLDLKIPGNLVNFMHLKRKKSWKELYTFPRDRRQGIFILLDMDTSLDFMFSLQYKVRKCIVNEWFGDRSVLERVFIMKLIVSIERRVIREGILR